MPVMPLLGSGVDSAKSALLSWPQSGIARRAHSALKPILLCALVPHCIGAPMHVAWRKNELDRGAPERA